MVSTSDLELQFYVPMAKDVPFLGRLLRARARSNVAMQLMSFAPGLSLAKSEKCCAVFRQRLGLWNRDRLSFFQRRSTRTLKWAAKRINFVLKLRAPGGRRRKPITKRSIRIVMAATINPGTSEVNMGQKPIANSQKTESCEQW